MSDPIQTIKSNRNQILIGEIGALLHDIGKCRPDFLKKQSVESVGNFDHWKIDQFLDAHLISLMKDSRFEISIDSDKADVYSIITEHHDKKTTKRLIQLMQSCDRLDSADDKGIVREKQPMNDTFISSPFGYPRQKIDLKCLKHRLDFLSHQLTDLFNKYISDSIDITTFREDLMSNLEFAFSQALGETRRPSNDVTLWDHSHSAASLFKSMLCKVALNETSSKQWRIFGFCWDGTGFINKGKKIADILERNRISENIKKELKQKFEDEIPVGNAIYEDTNGIYFTFPDLGNYTLREVACECAREGLEITRCNSTDEIFPFFVVSEPSRTLTILAEILRFASVKRKIPKMSPLLYIGNDLDGEKIEDNPEARSINGNQDICPICQYRPKSIKSEACDVCRIRRKERRDEWFLEREQTIWIDEIADENGNVGLVTLNFDLNRWLDGSMVQTIYSQSFEDWYSSRGERIHSNKDYMRKISKSIGIEIEDGVSKKNLATYFMKFFIVEESKDPNFQNDSNNVRLRARVLSTFFEGFDAAHEKKDKNGQDNPTYVGEVWENLKLRTGDVERILDYLFTQNSSPARLYRIWKETEEFLGFLIRRIKEGEYNYRWKRLRFETDFSKLIPKNSVFIKEKTSYILKIKNLEPENLLVLHHSDGKFYTIESLGKFRFKSRGKSGKISGIKAVRKALKTGLIYHLAEEDTPGENLLDHEQRISIPSNEEEYYPLIEITRSPVSLRMVIPASESIKILRLITELYSERFANVAGKMPLNMGLLVSKRKFPLYVLLDAGERILNDETFKKSITMNPYWNTAAQRTNKYYRFYPIKNPTYDEYYTLDHLEHLVKGRLYALCPGYFDFDLLTSTMCRYRINYNNRRRAGGNCGDLSGRPYYFYQITEMIEIREILSNISSSQQSIIEETLKNKIVEWKTVSDPNKGTILRTFAEAVLKDAFADKWENLRKETQDFLVSSAINGLLLDTISLFEHMIKAPEVDENEAC
jgi:CRISPR-associated Csx11 family protein